MKLKDVTSENETTVQIIKMNSPGKPTVKVYDMGPTRFIHEYSTKSHVLSISSMNREVSHFELEYAVKKIMKLNLIDIVFNKKSNGVVFIRKKPKGYPREAY